MRRPTLLIALIVFICSDSLAQGNAAAKNPDRNRPEPLVMERDLLAGGTVVLEMNVGDVTIVPNANANRIRLEIRADHQDAQDSLAASVKRFDVAGDRATLELRVAKDHEHCLSCYSASSVTLYVPAQSLLKVRLGVGDLTVQRVRGDKDLHVGIGDLRIGYDGNDEYAHIETSTHIGDIDDPLRSREASGFLGKSEDFSRQGRFHLRASVGIGELNLFAEGQP